MDWAVIRVKQPGLTHLHLPHSAHYDAEHSRSSTLIYSMNAKVGWEHDAFDDVNEMTFHPGTDGSYQLTRKYPILHLVRSYFQNFINYGIQNI